MLCFIVLINELLTRVPLSQLLTGSCARAGHMEEEGMALQSKRPTGANYAVHREELDRHVVCAFLRHASSLNSAQT